MSDPKAIQAALDAVKVPAKFRKDAQASAGYKLGFVQPRSLSSIAVEIRATWKPVNYAAAPYLDVLSGLSRVLDPYGADDAKGMILYFLSNATSWRGPVAEYVKAELQAMLDNPQPVHGSDDRRARVQETAGNFPKE